MYRQENTGLFMKAKGVNSERKNKVKRKTIKNKVKRKTNYKKEKSAVGIKCFFFFF